MRRDHLVAGAAAQPIVILVDGGDAGVADPQPDGGRAFPLGREAAHVRQPHRVAAVGQAPHDAASRWGLQLPVVTDEDHLAPGRLGAAR